MLKQCRGYPTHAGKQVLKRLGRGEHPSGKKGVEGVRVLKKEGNADMHAPPGIAGRTGRRRRRGRAQCGAGSGPEWHQGLARDRAGSGAALKANPGCAASALGENREGAGSKGSGRVGVG